MEQKKEIRREVRQRIKALDDAEKLSSARQIFAAIERDDAFAKARCIALYASLADEVPTAEVIERWSGERRVVLPRVEGDVMRFYDYSPEQMAAGYSGIAEPTGEVECPPCDIDLIIVPARAFTISGVRLGRGGGFYDKYMSLDGFCAEKIGVAFACQIFEELPLDAHDVTVDKVVNF